MAYAVSFSNCSMIDNLSHLLGRTPLLGSSGHREVWPNPLAFPRRGLVLMPRASDFRCKRLWKQARACSSPTAPPVTPTTLSLRRHRK
jgi:hypothetical protein